MFARTITTIRISDDAANTPGIAELVGDRMNTDKPETYHHTQDGPWYLLLYALTAVCLTGSWFVSVLALQITLLVAGLLMYLLAVSFRHLTVADEGNYLAIRFSLFIEEFNSVAACVQNGITAVVVNFPADEMAVMHQHRLDDVGGSGETKLTQDWCDKILD
jgi:hypothetical protein